MREDLAARPTTTPPGSFDRLLIHVDADVRDYGRFPIAENTGLRGGLDVPLTRLLTALCTVPNWSALTLTEINPDHAPDPEHAFDRLIKMLGSVLPAT